MNLIERKFLLLVIAVACFAFACKSTSRTDEGFDILGPSDETAEAGELIAQANEDLTRIKILYKENEGNEDKPGKRLQLKKALESNDAESVKKISDDIVYLINEGADHGKNALAKIQQAQDMKINGEYKEYLRLKEEALSRQLAAFENYRQAARTLRENYDPNNAQIRDRVKAEFEQRSENYRSIMEKARDFSNQANELYKETRRKESETQ